MTTNNPFGPFAILDTSPLKIDLTEEPFVVLMSIPLFSITAPFTSGCLCTPY